MWIVEWIFRSNVDFCSLWCEIVRLWLSKARVWIEIENWIAAKVFIYINWKMDLFQQVFWLESGEEDRKEKSILYGREIRESKMLDLIYPFSLKSMIWTCKTLIVNIIDISLFLSFDLLTFVLIAVERQYRFFLCLSPYACAIDFYSTSRDEHFNGQFFHDANFTHFQFEHDKKIILHHPKHKYHSLYTFTHHWMCSPARPLRIRKFIQSCCAPIYLECT